jgi:hypothetical protein
MVPKIAEGRAASGMMFVSWDLEAGCPDGAAVIKVLDEDGAIHIERVVTDRAEIEAILEGLGV